MTFVVEKQKEFAAADVSRVDDVVLVDLLILPFGGAAREPAR